MSAALQDVRNISFCCDILTTKGGRQLKKIRPDADGYYTIPLAVLGTITDNMTYYEVEDFVPQITNPNSFVNKLLTDGKLYGEYGHPEIRLLPKEAQVPRLMMILEKNTSHHIKKIWTDDKQLESGGKLIYGLVKPTGPYGEFLKQNFDDPNMNTSFSLRSIAIPREVNGITRRRIQHLVTFDYVLGGGYPEAAKRFAPATEARIEIPLTPGMLQVCHTAMESITGCEINEIFGARMITVETKRVAYDTTRRVLRDADGTERSVFTAMLTK